MAVHLIGRAVDAVLFDVDGTLVDSNYLHVYAWMSAFADAGVDAPSWRVHRDIGMDSGRLLRDLLGDTDHAVATQVKDGHSQHYARQKSLLRPIAGAQDLLRRLAADGLRIVLATSAPPDELEELRRVLDCDDVISAETNADDVDEAKPEPDIVHVALDRIGVNADRAIFVGDAVWDMQAARAAGLACIGVLTGGVSAADLTDAGAVQVYDSVAEIRTN